MKICLGFPNLGRIQEQLWLRIQKLWGSRTSCCPMHRIFPLCSTRWGQVQFVFAFRPPVSYRIELRGAPHLGTRRWFLRGEWRRLMLGVELSGVEPRGALHLGPPGGPEGEVA